MKIRLIITAFIILVAGFGLMLLSQNDDPIRIGATMSLSGSFSTQGVPAHNGYKLCEADINANGGVLDRNIEFIIYDDESSTDKAIELYEKLITEDKVDAIMGPYGSTLTEAVAPVTEKHEMVHISPLAATSSIWEQGREFLFMVLPPAELFLAGLIDIADQNDFSRIAIIQEDALFPKAAGEGAKTLAEERGMEITLHETYPAGSQDFSEIVEQISSSNTEVVGMAASTLSGFIAFVKELHEQEVDLKMFGSSGAVTEYQQELGALAENTFGLSAWEPSVPNPGAEEFAEAYENEFGMTPSFHAAGAYGSCQLFVEAIKNTRSLNQEILRNELLSMETTTIFSDFSVDERGYQTANKGLFIQWQDGKKEVVWPEDMATANIRF